MRYERVLKFGGAALADGPGVLRACQIVAKYGGERPLVVVSAHHGVTSLLETVARSAAEGHLEADRVRIRHRSLLAQLALDSELLDRYFHELFTLLSEIRSRGKLLERERDLALSAQARAAVDEIDAALAKIATGTYGICDQCGKPIPKERLRAIPYAALCVQCKSMGLGRR